MLVGGPLTEPIPGDRTEAGVTPLVGKMMGTDLELPRCKGSTLEPLPGAIDQKLLDQEVTGRAVRRLHPGRIRPGLPEIRRLYSLKMDMVVMRQIVITLIGQRTKKAKAHKEEKTSWDVLKGLRYIMTSSVVGESKSRSVSLLKNIRAQCLIG